MDKQTRKNQFNKVYQAFFDQPMTMLEAEKLTGIMRSNICWYCRDFRQSERIFKIGEKYCSISKHKAGIWTTNTKLKPDDKQLQLFEI